MSRLYSLWKKKCLKKLAKQSTYRKKYLQMYPCLNKFESNHSCTMKLLKNNFLNEEEGESNTATILANSWCI